MIILEEYYFKAYNAKSSALIGLGLMLSTLKSSFFLDDYWNPLKIW